MTLKLISNAKTEMACPICGLQLSVFECPECDGFGAARFYEDDEVCIDMCPGCDDDGYIALCPVCDREEIERS